MSSRPNRLMVDKYLENSPKTPSAVMEQKKTQRKIIYL